MSQEGQPVDRRMWRRIRTVFDEAVELPEAERAGFVSKECAGDPDLATWVLTMLEAESRAADFLDGSVDAFSALILDEDPDGTEEGLPPGTEIPPYRVVREIGRGGMGRVYLAERADGQFEQRVALKLVQHALGARAIQERFLQERQILAGLQHPNIARLIDGGMTPDGRPFFAMEYIEGRTITRYVEEEGSGQADRIRLMLDVCHAVAYAQQRLVVHRDLKPGNILVSNEGQVKLLDFGIAKLLVTTDNEAMTLPGSRPLTPEYAAPEQVSGGGITTATDVYALGCILFEVLTGARLKADGREPRATPGLPQDLANIVAMATQEEAERRYPTAAAMGMDLTRYLDGHPVAARAPSLAYRTAKFVRRNAMGVSALAAVLVLLVGGILTTTWQARRAERQAVRAEQVTRFLVGLFREADPDQAQGEDATASVLLDRGITRVESELPDEPELRADMYRILGEIQTKRGAYQSAEQMYRHAHSLNRATRGDRHPRTITCLLDIGNALYYQSRYAEAESVFTLAGTGASLGPETHARALGNLASAKNQLGKFEEAESLYIRTIEIDTKLHGRNHLEVATDLSNYARFLDEASRYAEAESLYQEVLTIRRTHLAEPHTDLALAYHNLAFTQENLGEEAEAERNMRTAVEMRRLLYGGDHPRLAASLRTLASMIRSHGNLEASEAIFREALAMSRATLGEVHHDVALCFNELGVVAFMQGDLRQAREQFGRALDIFKQLLPEDHPTVLVIQGSLGRVAFETGDLDQAERVYTEFLATTRRKHGEAHPRTADALIAMAMIHGERERWQQSLDLCLQALEVYRGVHEGPHRDVAMSETYVARALGELGEVAQAEGLLREALAFYEAEVTPDHPRRVDAEVRLGRVLLQAGRPGEALPLLERAEPIRFEAYGDRDGRTAEVMGLRGSALRRLGRADEARFVLDEAIRISLEARGPQDLSGRRATAERALIPYP